MKILLILGALVALATTGYAQTTDVPGQGKKVEPVSGPDLTVERGKVSDAKVLAKSGNVAAAETAVATLNRAKPNTTEWHLETAQRLVQTAEQLARDGDGAQVEKLVRRALQQLSQAMAKAKDDASRAAVRSLEGFLQERYLADNDAAAMAYEAAAKLAPAEAKGAGEAAERLKQTKERRQEVEKVKGKKG